MLLFAILGFLARQASSQSDASCWIPDACVPSEGHVMIQKRHTREKLLKSLEYADEPVEESGMGSIASFDEDGYQSVAKLCCSLAIETYIRRVVDHMGLIVCNEYGILGLVPWYSCETGAVGTQTYAKLEANIMSSIAPVRCAIVAKNGSCPPASSYEACGGHSDLGAHRRRACAKSATTTPATAIATTAITVQADAGSTTIEVASTAGMAIGDEIIIGAGTVLEESNVIAGFSSIILQTPLKNTHPAGVVISTTMGQTTTTRASASTSLSATKTTIMGATTSTPTNTVTIATSTDATATIGGTTSAPWSRTSTGATKSASRSAGATKSTPRNDATNATNATSRVATTRARKEKRGIICMAKTGCMGNHTNAMTGQVSWFYNYRQRIDVPGSPHPGVLQWANKNKVEFVPMIRGRQMDLINGTRCYITSFGGPGESAKVRQKTPQCSMQHITDTFAQLNSEMVVKPKYLMGFNEPYVLHSSKEMAPSVAAEYFRHIFLPVAAKFGYKLVSPTSAPQDVGDLAGDDGLSEDKMGWLVDFLVACYKARKSAPPCDYTKIPIISLHKYTCKAKVWDQWFGTEQKFKTILLKRLNKATPSRKAPGWKPYVKKLKFWVTETNCNWDGSKDNGPEPKEQCNRIAGKGGPKYGKGSLQTMEAIDDIERYSWWNLYNALDRQMTQVAKLTNFDGSLTPIGKAYRALSWKKPNRVKC